MDIWYHVAASLDPLDILALRTTCSSLLGLCGQRSVWLQAARTMCRSHGLFLPSFPFESMSVKELIRLALSPSTFSRLVSQEGEGRLPEKRSQSFNPRLKSSEQDLSLRSLHLLPGGRYLIIYQDDDVCLWDLGYGSAPPSQSPIACLHVEGVSGLYTWNPPCPTEDGKGVRLIVLSDNHSASTLGVYDICPGSEEPRFRCTTSWQVPLESYILGYSSRYAVLCTGTEVQLYTVNDVGIGGSRCDRLFYATENKFPVAILGDTVLLSMDMECGSLNVFSIPRALASAATERQPHLVVPCSPTRGERDTEGTLYTSEWTASLGYTFFALSGEVSNSLELRLFRMVDLASLSEPLLPSAIPVKVCGISFPKWNRFIGGANLQRMSSGLAMVGVSSGDAVAIAKIAVPHAACDGLPTLSIKTLTVETLDDEGRFDQEVSACVATGRLVVAIPSKLNGTTEWVVEVLDYLSLP
ncbi:hypothetical protein BKA70DRAFT_1175494 [Coprinopsis sp. MPI-PUGE-AT-0042]|nr:hypothetical protein BKA70DRAFT_1175494 [Coprinopsis sp. MPI-PUGE-AT-0042]